MNQDSSICRVIKNKNYSIICNEFLKRNDISWKAKGILTYCLSMPDDWEFHFNELKQHSSDGETSFRSGWRELMNLGYIEYTRITDPVTKQIIKHEYIIREQPIKKEEDSPENKGIDPQPGFQDMGNQDLGNQDILITNKQNTKKTNLKEGTPPSAMDLIKNVNTEKLKKNEIVKLMWDANKYVFKDYPDILELINRYISIRTRTRKITSIDSYLVLVDKLVSMCLTDNGLNEDLCKDSIRLSITGGENGIYLDFFKPSSYKEGTLKKPIIQGDNTRNNPVIQKGELDLSDKVY